MRNHALNNTINNVRSKFSNVLIHLRKKKRDFFVEDDTSVKKVEKIEMIVFDDKKFMPHFIKLPEVRENWKNIY